MLRRAASDRVRRTRWLARNRLGRHPALLPLTILGHPELQVVGRHTALCIDGYPRSATTFAVAAFQLAQPAPVEVVHHSHAPGQIIAAAKWGIPCLVTLREPEAAVLSMAIYKPYITMEQALNAYVRFYEAISPFAGSFIIGEFRTVTSRLGSVIRAINARFGTDFQEFEQTSENLEAAFELIELGVENSPTADIVYSYFSGERNLEELQDSLRRDFGISSHKGTPASTATIARPCSERTVLKDQLRDAYQKPGLVRLRQKADDVYTRLAWDALD